MIRIELEGSVKLTDVLRGAGSRATRALAAGLVNVAEDIIRDAEPMVPFDTGRLRGSAGVLPPEVTPMGVAVTFGYGGDASDYAIVQHERTDFHHTVGQAKFLEQAVLNHAGSLDAEIANHAARSLEF